MALMTLPVTIYSARSAKSTTRLGSPAWIPLQWGSPYSVGLARVSLDAIPAAATIIKATLRITTDLPNKPVNMYNLVTAPTASNTWAQQPVVGSLIVGGTNAAAKTLALDVTAWAATRPRTGFRLQTTSTTQFFVASQTSPYIGARPVIDIEYTLAPLAPGNQMPKGGAVSIPKPPLTYTADATMTDQLIEIDKGGVVWSSGWTPATRGYFEQPAGAPSLSNSQSVSWRVKVRNSQGESPWSPWVSYSYVPLPTVTPIGPGATTADGSPTVQWETDVQTAFYAWLFDTDSGQIIDQTPGWVNSGSERAWTPSKGVKVPDGHGNFMVDVRDNVVRVAATGAPTEKRIERAFTTTLTGAGSGMNSLNVEFEDPIPKFSGVRNAGIPDEISLLRDGFLVPIWNADGEAGLRMPGSDFFTGNNFVVRDYTADLRKQHTWKVLAWTNGVPSAVNPEITRKFNTRSVWLVHPQFNNKIEILGHNELPVVEQAVTESAVVHTPVSGGINVEPVRRRQVRTTRAGSINGVVFEEQEDILTAWVEAGSNERFRLIFGKVNWSVIIGDHSPTDLFYSDNCGPGRVLVSLNWWQRKADF